MTDAAKIAFAYLRSWRRTPGTWTIEDYPIRVGPNGGDSQNGYRARVLRWPTMDGFGATSESAILDLAQSFDARTERPRPGVKVPIRYAANDRLGAYGDWAYDVVERITGIRPLFLSDGSSLRDFATDDAEFEGYLRRVREVYDVDVTDVEHGELATILDRLAGGGQGPADAS